MLVASTVAPETAAPEVSVTLPSMPPVTAVWPYNMPMLKRERTATTVRQAEYGGVHRGVSLDKSAFDSELRPEEKA